jgi:hypothetical protein
MRRAYPLTAGPRQGGRISLYSIPEQRTENKELVKNKELRTGGEQRTENWRRTKNKEQRTNAQSLVVRFLFSVAGCFFSVVPLLRQRAAAPAMLCALATKCT